MSNPETPVHDVTTLPKEEMPKKKLFHKPTLSDKNKNRLKTVGLTAAGTAAAIFVVQKKLKKTLDFDISTPEIVDADEVPETDN